MTTPAVAVRSGGKTQQGRVPAPDRHQPGRIQGGASSPGRTRTARPSPAPPPRASQGPQPARRRGPSASGQRRQVSVQAARSARSTAVSQPSDYQKIIAAEFVLAEVLIALTPMTSRKQPTDVSPYVPRDMTKLLAVGVTYFLLMLAAIPSGWGKPAAWFGALILLAVGLNEGANVANDIDALAGVGQAVRKVGSGVGKGLSGGSRNG